MPSANAIASNAGWRTDLGTASLAPVAATVRINSFEPVGQRDRYATQHNVSDPEFRSC